MLNICVMFELTSDMLIDMIINHAMIGKGWTCISHIQIWCLRFIRNIKTKIANSRSNNKIQNKAKGLSMINLCSAIDEIFRQDRISHWPIICLGISASCIKELPNTKSWKMTICIVERPYHQHLDNIYNLWNVK